VFDVELNIEFNKIIEAAIPITVSKEAKLSSYKISLYQGIEG
jgi:hypothetical protein